MGTINNVIPFSLIVWGQTHIASGLASILNATAPLFTVVVAGVLLQDERITVKKGIGVIVGFFGVIIMIGPSALEGLGVDAIAQVAMLGAAISYAFAGVYGRRFKEMGINPVITAAGQVTASSLIMIPIAFYFDHPFLSPLPSSKIWAAIVGLAILSTALAYILYFRILASAGATNLLLVTFLIPVSAIILGSVVLKETLDSIHFIGMFLISIGLSLIDERLWSKKELSS
jgi:drug/metabolite transporter (DMT)-like permease